MDNVRTPGIRCGGLRSVVMLAEAKADDDDCFVPGEQTCLINRKLSPEGQNHRSATTTRWRDAEEAAKTRRKETRGDDAQRERKVQASHTVQNGSQGRTSHELQRVTAKVKKYTGALPALGMVPASLWGGRPQGGARSQRFKAPHPYQIQLWLETHTLYTC